VKPYETYVYSAAKMRSPFQPQGPGAGNGLASLRANTRRNREFLEGFSLDTLKMVGTFKVAAAFMGCPIQRRSRTQDSARQLLGQTTAK